MTGRIAVLAGNDKKKGAHGKAASIGQAKTFNQARLLRDSGRGVTKHRFGEVDAVPRVPSGRACPAPRTPLMPSATASGLLPPTSSDDTARTVPRRGFCIER